MDVNQKYTSLLNEQIAKIGKECRYLEFKSNYQEVDKLGRYISALSNGACLDHKDFAYLYFGVDDETLEIKGTTFDCARMKAVGNEALELYLRRMVVPKVNFSIIEFMYEGNCVLCCSRFLLLLMSQLLINRNHISEWTAMLQTLLHTLTGCARYIPRKSTGRHR